jgi:hypothetical protein
MNSTKTNLPILASTSPTQRMLKIFDLTTETPFLVLPFNLLVLPSNLL